MDLDLDIPLPTATAVAEVSDTFTGPAALKLAFVGVGQAGGRIAATFRELGYRRVCAVNTTLADLAELTALPEDCKLDIGQATGAAKDPQTAAALVADKGEDLFDLYRRSWGNQADQVLVCLAAGGGTGAGAHPKVIEVAQRYLASCHQPVKIGAIVALPKEAEGYTLAKNAIGTLQTLRRLDVSPLLLLDNQQVLQLFNPVASREKTLANSTTAKLLHAFNQIAGSASASQLGSTFDRAELGKLLGGGVVAFGTYTCQNWASGPALAAQIREELRKNMLAAVDLTQAQLAGLIYVVYGSAFDEVRAADLDYGAQMLSRMLAPGATVFQGLYHEMRAEPGVRVLVMVSGLPWPRDRLHQLALGAGMSRDELAKSLGV